MTRTLRRAAFVVAISSFARSQLYRWVDHAHWAKVHVVHCGLDRGFHAVAAVPPPTRPRLVCVGRLCEQKGQLLLLQAAHALRVVFDEADSARDAGEERVILVNLSGHGHFDMAAYDTYHAGQLEDLEFSEAEMDAALESLPEAPALA